jgi:wyosine [tRNA(Phe)-imidazoG37] synthetase (radical SAM superfamily)
MQQYKYIYGPVASWRIGRSLGIDIVPRGRKICTFDCIYCQLGRARPVVLTKRIQGPLKSVIAELNALPEMKIDYITFSGSGEPTLSKNLADIIKAIKKIRKEKIAVFTNATLLYKKDVQQALRLTDLVEVKLDADTESVLRAVNNPSKGIKHENIVSGIKEFKKRYKGRLCLQIMFVKNNIKHAENIAAIARLINPDTVHLNTPLRPSGEEAISKKDMERVKMYFRGLDVISVYDNTKRIKTHPIDIQATKKRRASL